MAWVELSLESGINANEPMSFLSDELVQLKDQGRYIEIQ